MKPSIRTVVIGTTLSEASDAVVREGIKVARAAGAAIHLVHAYELPIVTDSVPMAAAPSVFPPIAEDDLVEDITKLLERQLKRLGEEDLGRIQEHVVRGPAHRILLALAARIEADLVIVGAADTFLGRVFGTTASRVLRAAECPVLLVRNRLQVPPERVLLPVDLSPISADVVSRGLAILAQLGADPLAAEIEAYYSVPPVDYDGYASEYRTVAKGPSGIAELDEFLDRHALGVGWNLSQRSENGPPRERILCRIETFRPNLAILGTHGASGFERFLIGSVAESVLRHATVSILVIPPSAAATEVDSALRPAVRQHDTQDTAIAAATH